MYNLELLLIARSYKFNFLSIEITQALGVIKMIKDSEMLIQLQAKPKLERQVTYFCRLCRNRGIKERKAHLLNCHNSSRDTITKRSSNDIVELLFVESR